MIFSSQNDCTKLEMGKIYNQSSCKYVRSCLMTEHYFDPYCYLSNGIGLDLDLQNLLVWNNKYLANCATKTIIVWFYTNHTSDLGKLDLITICFSDNSRKPLYFSNDISACLLHLISQSRMYNKINPSPVK